MAFKHPLRAAAAAATLLLGACASGAVNLQTATSSCSARPDGHVEVYIPDAVVVRVLGERDSRSGLHEGFVIRANGRTFRVEDNVDISGPIPLRRDDVVSLLGQFECDDDVIHWTHRDPHGRHPAGYVKVNGRLYD